MMQIKQSNKQRLNRLLDYANTLAKFEQRKGEKHTIFMLSKILTDKITLDNAMELLQTLTTGISRKHAFCSFDLLTQDDIPPFVYNEVFGKQPLDNSIVVDLSTDPVLTFPWNVNRLENNLDYIASCACPWKEDKSNHFADLWLPMGVTWINNGMHSCFIGMIKRSGNIILGNGTHNHIYDMSSLYKCMRFDGTYYRDENSNKKLFKAHSFDFGCLFEVGRIIMNANISLIQKE